MTPKEKAEELVDKFYPMFTNSVRDTLSKQCALIAVDEILKELSPLELHPLGTYINPKIDYWQEVKQEIEKL